ncbi:MAG: DUF2071 domain-containing protein [Salinivenus sp.]
MSTASSASCPVVLRATARHRVGVGYHVSPDHLAPHLPAGLVPDAQSDTALIGLVGVHLTDVRVLGLRGPGFRHVPAVELQAAVRHPPTDRRGRITLQSYTSRRLVAWGARTLYDEPVAVASMQPVRRTPDDRVAVTYRFDWQGREQRLRVEGAQESRETADVTAPFLGGGPWRFASGRDGRLSCAHLDRDAREGRPADTAHVAVDWLAAGGAVGALLADRTPDAAWMGGDGPLALRWRERLD